MLQREKERDAKSLSLQRCGHPVRQIWIRMTTASRLSFKRGSTVRSSMMWRSWKNVCWASGGCWTTPSSWQWLYSGVGLVVWMHVFTWILDILNFEPLSFCCVLFVSPKLVYINVININICKVLILREMWLSHGMIATTKVWQEILMSMTLAFSGEVVHEKLWKSVNICNVTAEKSVAPFLCGHGVGYSCNILQEIARR